MDSLEKLSGASEAAASCTGQADEAAEACCADGSITRRSFAAGAACAIGSIFLEPVLGLGSTFWLPGTGQHSITDGAFADETNTVTVDAGKFCVIVYDAAVGVSSYASGVKVRIKSLYNDQEVEGTSGDDGRIMFDISPLARTMHSSQAGDFMEFDAAITVTADNHREVFIPRMHIMDGLAIQVPTRALDGNPYLRTISFDDWDVQYNEQQFVLSPANDVDHTLKCELFFPSGGLYNIQPVIGKSATDSRVGYTLCSMQTIQANDGEFKTFTFTDRLLSTTRSVPLEPGDVVALNVTDGNLNPAFSVQTGLGVFRAPCDEGFKQDSDNIAPVNSGSSSDATTKAGLRQVSDQKITLPSEGSGMPKCLANQQFSCWTPSFPIVFRYDPQGHIMFGLDLEILNYSNSKDEFDGDTSWRSQPRESVAMQLKRKIQLFKNKFNDASKMMSDALNGKKVSPKVSKAITLNVTFQLIAQMDYSDKNKKWEGDFAAVIGGTVSGSYTQQAMLFIVPVYVNIEGSLSVAASLAYAISSDCSDLSGSSGAIENLARILSRLRFNPNGTLSLAINIAFALSLGIGIHKLASAGVRGGGGFSFTFDWRDNAATAYAGKPDPRLTIGANVEVSIYGEFLFFKKTKVLGRGSWPSLYDSDRDSASATASLTGADGDAAAEVDATIAAIEAQYSAVKEGGAYYLPGIADASLAADEAEGFVIVREAELAARAEVVVTVSEDADVASADASLAFAGAAAGAAVAAGDGAAAAVEPLRAAAFSADEWTVAAENIVTADMVAPAAAAAAAASDDADSGLAAVTAANGYSYEWTEGHESKYDDRASGDAVICGLGSRGGVRPRHMDLLAKDVFSAASGKLIEVNGVRYLFRIAPVIYNGKTLGRIVYQSITDTAVSKPFPVTVDTSTIGKTRDVLHDYDFDVRIARKDEDNPSILLLIVSGERPKDEEKTTIYDVAEATVATAVQLGLADPAFAETQGAFVAKSAVSWQSPTYEETKQYYMFRSPSLIVRGDHSKAAYGAIESDDVEHEFGFFLVDHADTKEGLFNSDSVKTGMSVVHLTFGDKPAAQLLSVNMPAGVSSIVPDCAQVSPSGDKAIFATFGFSTQEGSGVRSVKLSFDKGQDGRNKLTSAAVIPVIDVDPYVKSLRAWEDAQSLLATVTTDADVLVAGSVAYLALADLPSVEEIEQHAGATAGFAEFEIACVSPESVPLGGLHARPGHKYCYYALNHSGLMGYDYGDGDATPHVEDPIYQIKALALVNGVFTKPFVFAECDTDIDSFLVVEETNDENLPESSFVMRHVTKAEDSKADLYAFDVPFLRSIGVEAASPVGPTVTAGEANEFTVAVRNTGNTVLTQARLEFVDTETGKAIDEVVLDFDQAENAENSGLYDDIYYEENMTDETKQSVLVADDGDAVLVPGQERMFVVDIEIPADWNGTKELTVNAPSDDISYIDPNTGEESVDGSGVAEYETAENNSVTVELSVSPAVVNDLDGRVLPGEETSGGAGGNGGEGSGSGSGSGKAAAGAKTGDGALGVLTPALAAAAAAGAGFAAYSARRSRLEREAAEGVEAEE